MIDLPKPVAAYIGASNIQDALRIGSCFTPDATVRDEGRLHRGRAAIVEWARDSAARYQAHMTPQDIVEADGGYRLRASVAGNFAGSPVVLSFRFVLQLDAIAALEVAP